MINYDNKNLDKNNYIKKLLSDYIYLSSLNNNLVGTYLFPYFDETNNFDIISFYNNLEEGNPIKSVFHIGDARVQIVNFNVSIIDNFKTDIRNEYILFDPTDKLNKLSKKNMYICPTNMLGLSNEYIEDIINIVNEKRTNRLNNYLQVFYTLSEYYKILLINKNYEMLQKNIGDILSDAPENIQELHNEALMNALSQQTDEPSRFLDDENIEIYKQITKKK